jgi:hypothetical protein
MRHHSSEPYEHCQEEIVPVTFWRYSEDRFATASQPHGSNRYFIRIIFRDSVTLPTDIR